MFFEKLGKKKRNKTATLSGGFRVSCQRTKKIGKLKKKKHKLRKNTWTEFHRGKKKQQKKAHNTWIFSWQPQLCLWLGDWKNAHRIAQAQIGTSHDQALVAAVTGI